MQPNLSFIPSFLLFQSAGEAAGTWGGTQGGCVTPEGVTASDASVPSSSEQCPERARRFCSFSWRLENQGFAGYSSLLWLQTLRALKKGK